MYAIRFNYVNFAIEINVPENLIRCEKTMEKLKTKTGDKLVKDQETKTDKNNMVVNHQIMLLGEKKIIK